LTIERRRLGRTGLYVSVLSLGTVELGLDYGIALPGERLKPSEAEAAELLRFALASGINLIDTAPVYGDSERIIGDAIGGRRSEYFISTKVPPDQPGAIRQIAEKSLANLRTSVIDIMMVHCRADELLPSAQTTSALRELQRDGLVRFLGASVYGPEAALATIRSGAFDCVQVGCSLLDRRPEEAVFAAAQREDVGIVARSVLLKGALSSRYLRLPESMAPLKGAVREVTEIAGAVERLPELAYRYLFGQNPPHTLLVGTARRSDVEDCIRYAEAGALDPATMRAIRALPAPDAYWLNPGNWPAGV
jgi:aryl-alcohol dehydrogenase-like predicted oxidoreductase